LDIWEDLNKLIEKYGLRLDIVYDDPHFKKILKFIIGTMKLIRTFSQVGIRDWTFY